MPNDKFMRFVNSRPYVEDQLAKQTFGREMSDHKKFQPSQYNNGQASSFSGKRIFRPSDLGFGNHGGDGCTKC